MATIRHTITNDCVGCVKADPAYSGASDFADGADAGDEYGYDANGNVVRDDNRGIKSIAYNPLNLPQEVRFADGHYIRQAYSADGRLLRRVTGQEPLRELPTRPWLGLGVAAADPAAFVFPGDKPILPDTSLLAKVETPDTVAWAGPFVLEGGKLDRELTPSGYIKADTAYYFLRDHQGSVRQVVSGADGSVVQENQYYPYGSLHGESSAQALANGASAQPYKYGGKEHIAFANAHLLDFTARTYDPALALFHQPDPLQEKHARFSNKLYCLANPISFCDPTGCDTARVDYKGNISVTRSKGPDVLICTDVDGNDHTMDGLPNGIFRNGIDETTKDGEEVDGFIIRGGKRSEEIFKFLAKHTSVEWSLIKTGLLDTGKGYITNGHLLGREPGMRHMLNTKLGYGYTLTEFWHSHVRAQLNPSDNDLIFKSDVLGKRKYSRFFLYLPILDGTEWDVLEYTDSIEP